MVRAVALQCFITSFKSPCEGGSGWQTGYVTGQGLDPPRIHTFCLLFGWLRGVCVKNEEKEGSRRWRVESFNPALLSRPPPSTPHHPTPSQSRHAPPPPTPRTAHPSRPRGAGRPQKPSTGTAAPSHPTRQPATATSAAGGRARLPGTYPGRGGRGPPTCLPPCSTASRPPSPPPPGAWERGRGVTVRRPSRLPT